MKSLCTLPIAELHKYAPDNNMIIMTFKLYISFFEILIICQFIYFTKILLCFTIVPQINVVEKGD